MVYNIATIYFVTVSIGIYTSVFNKPSIGFDPLSRYARILPQSATLTAPPEEEPTFKMNFSRLFINPSVGYAASSPKGAPSIVPANFFHIETI